VPALAASIAVGVVTVIIALPYAWIAPIDHLGTRFLTMSALGNELAASAQGLMLPTAARMSLQSVGARIPGDAVTLLAAAALGLFAAPARPGQQRRSCWCGSRCRCCARRCRHAALRRHPPLSRVHGTARAARGPRPRGSLPLVVRALARARWLAFAVVLVPIGESANATRASAFRTAPATSRRWSADCAARRHVHLPNATDYWCSSYWAEADWLVRTAEHGAQVVCPVASHVLEAIVPGAVRADLRLLSDAEAPESSAPFYVVYVTRSEFYPRWLQQTRARHEPVFRIEVQGGTILEVLRVDSAGNGGELEAFRTQLRAQALGLQVLQELQLQRPAALRQLWGMSMARARVARAGYARAVARTAAAAQ